MTEMELSALYCYPIKSARGHALQEASTDRFGLAGDRRWLVIDQAGQFISQRSHPLLALLEVMPTAAGLRLGTGGDAIDVARPGSDASRVPSTVWGDSVDAQLADASASDWLSRRFGEDLRLVYCPDDAQRAVDEDSAPPGQQVAFADGFPLLIVGQASLDGLNQRLATPVPMDRFRPNLVIAGGEAHAEDRWRRIRIGDTEVALVKPCSRCAIPSINQLTGERDRDINRVLASYRRRDGVIYFGMNALVPAGAHLHLGDPVEVIA